MPNTQLGAVVGYVRHLAMVEKSRDQTDSDLLRAFLSGDDQPAFTELVRRHAPMVQSVCRRVLHHTQDAEDAFQATFLVLARKAHSVRKAESLASWLHGVAYRMATDARRAASRRRQYENQATSPQPVNPAWSAAWREVQLVLDEEIERLPMVYRQPFILCCLENRSCSEVAKHLGQKEGTVWSRVARARKKLQQNLSKRGVSLASVFGVSALSGNTAVSAVPPSMIASTVKAALSFAAGKAIAADLVSAQVTTLAKGAIRSLLSTQLKSATLVVVAAGLLTTAGLLTHQALAGKPVDDQQQAHTRSDSKGKSLVIKPGIAIPKEAVAQPKPGKVQPNRIDFGTVHVGATVEANFMVLTPGKDAKIKLEVTAPIFVKVLRTTTDTQEYGPGNPFVRGSVEIAIDTAKVGNLEGQISVKLGEARATVPVSAFVKPQRTGLMRLLVVETPFHRFATQDGSAFKPWTDLVAGSPWDVSYLPCTRGQPVLPNLDVSKTDAVLLDPEAVLSLSSDDVKRVRTFAEAGGLVLVAANHFFVGSPTQANKLLVPYGLEMRDEERHLGSDNLTLGKDDLDPQVVRAGIESIHFFRGSPVAIKNGTPARALVRAVNVGQPGDAFVATAKAGRGNVVAIGQSLWWDWIGTNRDPSGGNAKLLRWILNHQHERRLRVLALDRSLTAAEVEGYWKNLASEDADKACEAIEWLTRTPAAERQTIPFLRQHLKPELRPNTERLRKLITDLDNDQFNVRETAQRELEKLGDVALPALQKQAEVTSSAEVRRRARAIINAPRHLSAEKWQAIRGVEVLEYFGTAEAKEHLEMLARGAPGSRLTDAAKVALGRLASQKKTAQRGSASEPR